MIVRHAQHRHSLAVDATAKAEAEEIAARKSLEAARDALHKAVDALIENAPIGEQ
jgi:hypothetical protein